MGRNSWVFLLCALICSCLFEVKAPELVTDNHENNPESGTGINNDSALTPKNGNKNADSIWVIDTSWVDNDSRSQNVTSYHYDSLNKLNLDTTFIPNPITYALQVYNIRNYIYDSSGDLVSIQNSTGEVHKFENGPNDKPKVEDIYSNNSTNTSSSQKLFEYDSNDSLIQYTYRKPSPYSASEWDTIAVYSYTYNVHRIFQESRNYTYDYLNGKAISTVQKSFAYYKYDDKNRLAFMYNTPTDSASSHHFNEYYYNVDDLLVMTVWSPLYKTITTTYKWKKVMNNGSHGK
jgi:hypothetical protein